MAVTQPSSALLQGRASAVLAPGGAKDPVVWLWGEYDVATVDALSAVLARTVALGDADVVVDMSGVQFMDGATVGVLVRTNNFLHLRSRRLVLRAPSRCAARVLDICGLNEFVVEAMSCAPSQT